MNIVPKKHHKDLLEASLKYFNQPRGQKDTCIIILFRVCLICIIIAYLSHVYYSTIIILLHPILIRIL